MKKNLKAKQKKKLLEMKLKEYLPKRIHLYGGAIIRIIMLVCLFRIMVITQFHPCHLSGVAIKHLIQYTVKMCGLFLAKCQFSLQ